MNEDIKSILKKLMRGTLGEEERRRLSCDVRVERRMRSQWDEAEGLPSSPMLERRIWERITGLVDGKRMSRRLWMYKITAVAASVLLLISVGTLIYQGAQDEERYMYVVASGIRSIEPISLPDGTSVRMGPNSQLTYPSRFTGKTREVELKGQAFFDVAKDAERPFTVHTENMGVTALGTAFEVFDHHSEKNIETILLNGRVKVDLEGPDVKNKQEVILSPNEMLVYDKQNRSMNVKRVNAETYSGWRNGILSFENEPLSMILTRLEPWFGRKVVCPDEIAEKYRFTFKVRDESLERILFMLSTTSPIRYREKDNEYELYIK